MGSINFMESPSEHLKRQAKRRKYALMSVIMAWSLLMCVLLVGANWMKARAIKTNQKISSELKLIEGRVALQTHLQSLQQEQQAAFCAAKILTAMATSPVKGIHLSAISFLDNWEMSGVTQQTNALDDLKSRLSNDFEKMTWKETFEQTHLKFYMEGTPAC